jgi:hypothetical protein
MQGEGIGLAGTCFIVAAVLKLCRVIDWSWVFITAFLWVPVLLTVAWMILLVLIQAHDLKPSPHRRPK